MSEKRLPKADHHEAMKESGFCFFGKPFRAQDAARWFFEERKIFFMASW